MALSKIEITWIWIYSLNQKYVLSDSEYSSRDMVALNFLLDTRRSTSISNGIAATL